MDCWRQWIRHRTASVNEYSTRYSDAIDDKQETNPNEWRLQDTKKNKQGSSGFVTEYPEDYTLPPHIDENGVVHELKPAGTSGELLTYEESQLHNLSKEVYNRRLLFGVAREQARKDLPLSTYTMAYWKIDLHNLLHFLSLRMDSHAQLEIRSYANIIGNEIVAKLFPLTWSAFQDYRLNAITLTARDIEMINWINESYTGEAHEYEKWKNLFQSNKFDWFEKRDDGTLKNSLERLEFEEKAKRLGIEIPWKEK